MSELNLSQKSGWLRRERWGRLAPSLLVGGVLAFLYRDVLLAGAGITFRDMGKLHWPIRHHFAARILRGELPEWYPFDGLGSSYAGNGVTGLFHPAVALHLWLPDGTALALGAVLGHVFAAAGMFRLLKAWGCQAPAALIGGLGFSLCGYSMSMDGNLPYLLAAAAIPWAALGLETGSVALCAASMALVALTGERAHTLFFGSALLLVLALTHARRRTALVHLAASGALALAASAVQLLPGALAIAPASGDAQSQALDRAWAFNPLRFFEFLTPGFLRLPSGRAPGLLYSQVEFASFWADSVFVGAALLALAVVALRQAGSKRLVTLLAGFGAFCLLTSVGANGNAPVFAALQRFVPGFGLLRFPEKGLVFVSFALAALAGLGAEAVLAGKAGPRSRRWLFGSLLAIVALLVGLRLAIAPLEGALFWLSGATASAAREELRTLLPAFQSALGSGALLAVLAVGLTLPLAWDRAQRWRGPALVASVLLPLVASATTFEAYRSTRYPPPRPGSVDQLERALGGASLGRARLFASYDTVSARCLPAGGCRTGLVREALPFFDLETCPGYLPMVQLGRSGRAMDDLPPEVFFLGFNVRYSLPADSWGADRANAFGLLEGPPPGERIRLVQGIRAGSIDDALAIASRPDFDPIASVPVETADPAFPDSAPVNPSVSVDFYRPEHIGLTASSQTDCTLFVADAFTAGWSATLDGKPAELVPGLVAGRALAFPKGQHRVELVFRTPGLRTGMVVSALAWGGLAGLAVAARRKSPSAGA